MNGKYWWTMVSATGKGKLKAMDSLGKVVCVNHQELLPDYIFV